MQEEGEEVYLEHFWHHSLEEVHDLRIRLILPLSGYVTLLNVAITKPMQSLFVNGEVRNDFRSPGNPDGDGLENLGEPGGLRSAGHRLSRPKPDPAGHSVHHSQDLHPNFPLVIVRGCCPQGNDTNFHHLIVAPQTEHFLLNSCHTH